MTVASMEFDGRGGDPMGELFRAGATETTPVKRSRRAAMLFGAMLVLTVGLTLASLVVFTGVERGVVAAYYFALHMMRGL